MRESRRQATGIVLQTRERFGGRKPCDIGMAIWDRRLREMRFTGDS